MWVPMELYTWMLGNTFVFVSASVSYTHLDVYKRQMLSHIMLAAEELWMELQTETEEHFAAKSYKNGDYVATLTLH